MCINLYTKRRHLMSALAIGRLSMYLELLWAGDLLALFDHVGEPVGPPVQVEDEAEGGVRHLLHTVARHIAHRDTHLPRSLQHKESLTHLFSVKYSNPRIRIP
jgi:hypothetical protein